MWNDMTGWVAMVGDWMHEECEVSMLWAKKVMCVLAW